MKKPSKKEWIYIGIIGAVILLLLLWKASKTVAVGGSSDDGNKSSYLTYNMPPSDGSGFTMPAFGNNFFGGSNLGGGGGCNGCDTQPYYGTNSDLANALGQSPDASAYTQSINSALANMPQYMQAQIAYDFTSGNLQDMNTTVLSNVPVLALSNSTTYSNAGDPAQQTGLLAPHGISSNV